MPPTVARGAKARVQLPESPVPITKRAGPKTNPQWREDFLAAYEATGGLYASAKTAGVDSTTVYDEFARDPRFKTRAEEARQQFADSQEHQLQKLGQQGNVVGPIVLLKKHRPHEYVEKNLSITAHFEAKLDDAAGQQLLQAMLAHLTPESVRALAPPSEP